MSHYTLRPQVNEIVTFKCAACGVRKGKDEAYNLSVSACSKECFEVCYTIFRECNMILEWDTQARTIIEANPIPLY